MELSFLANETWLTVLKRKGVAQVLAVLRAIPMPSRRVHGQCHSWRSFWEAVVENYMEIAQNFWEGIARKFSVWLLFERHLIRRALHFYCRATFYHRNPDAAKTKASAKQSSNVTVSTAACTAVEWPIGTERWSAHAEALPAITAEAILEHLLKMGSVCLVRTKLSLHKSRFVEDTTSFSWLCPR